MSNNNNKLQNTKYIHNNYLVHSSVFNSLVHQPNQKKPLDILHIYITHTYIYVGADRNHENTFMNKKVSLFNIVGNSTIEISTNKHSFVDLKKRI